MSGAKPEARYLLASARSPGRWVAVDENQRPAVIFELPRSGMSSPRRLANLWYLPPAPMELSGSFGVSQVSAAVLVCRSDDVLLRQHFTRLAEAIFGRDLSDVASEIDIEARLDAFVALLAALRAPPQQTAQGLWAELAAIAWSENAETSVLAWHEKPRDLHDFSQGGNALEIKSTLSGDSEHEVALDQLDESGGLRIVLWSMRLELHDDGTSVGELVERILERLTSATELQRKVERVVYESLGHQWEVGTSVRIREQAALKSSLLYSAASIPSVLRPVPIEVSRVRFSVDLGTTPPLQLDSARAWSGWWHDVLPALSFDA